MVHCTLHMKNCTGNCLEYLKFFVGYMALYKFLWLLLTRGDFNRFWVVEGDYSCGCVLDTRTSMSFLSNRNISVALFQKNYKKFLKGIPHYFLTMPLFSVISSKFSCIFCARLWCSVLPVSTGHVVSSSMVYCRVSSSEVKCTYFFWLSYSRKTANISLDCFA